MNDTTAAEFITLATMPTHVRFRGDGGWPIEREQARQKLTVGDVYIIQLLNVGRSSSTVFIADFGGRSAGEYNTAMFDFLAWAVDLEPGDVVAGAAGPGTTGGDDA